MREMLQTINSRLARRVGLYVILVSTFLSIFTSGLQIYSEFEREKNNIYSTLDEIEQTQIDNIASRLWVLDESELKKSLISVVDHHSVYYIEVYEDGTSLMSAGEVIHSNVIRKSYPLTYKANNKINSIGKVVILASLDDVYQHVFDRATLIILTNIIKTFFVAIFILLIFYKLVSRHLTSVSEYLAEEKSVPGNKKLSLNRNSQKRDELDLLVDTINDMKDGLSQQFEVINQQKQYLSQTLNSIGDAVITTDINGNITRMNPVAEELTGWSGKDAEGQSIKTVFSIINADTREKIENPIDKVMKTGEVVYLSEHTVLLSKNGKQFHIAADSAAPIKDVDGDILGMVLVFNDVTEQYELREQAILNEKKYRILATVSPVGLFYTDVNGECLYVNEKWSEISGLSRAEALGKGWVNAIYSEDKDFVFKEWNAAANNKTPFKLEYRFQNDNDIKWVLGQALAEEDADGKVIGYVGTITDITERKQAEYALGRSQKMDALGKLTGGIAHDYNNMLCVILGYTELLETKLKEKPNLLGYVNEISNAGNRGAKLTSKLLSFSRQKAADSEIININSIIKAEENLLEKTLMANVKITLDLDDDIGMSKLDAGDLENAVINLCINASHAIDAHGEINIKTRNTSIDDIDYVSLSISDDGCGIEEQEIEKIFDPFYSTKGELGTGLGLSQVYGFIERSEGIITVESNVGIGTKFVLFFPRYFKSENNSTKLENIASVEGIVGTETILVVDDEVALLGLCEDFLGSKGYKVFSAENGDEALNILENESVDLLLSDVVMPDMDGYELASIVKIKYPAIKIIMASGYTRNYDNSNADSDEPLLRKPYQMDELLNRIHTLLNT